MENLAPESVVTDIDVSPMPESSAEFRPDPVTPEAPPEKPMSLDDALKKAVSETKAEPAKDAKPEVKVEAKAEEKPKPERGENGKFTAKPKAEVEAKESLEGAADEADGDTEREQAESKPSEGKDISRAPAQFLPRAKEKWGSVDPDVQGEVHRMRENYEKGIEAAREDREFRKSVRHFEDMAKQAGTTLSGALENYVRIDQELRTNPEQALSKILQSINLTPESYAQYIMGQKQQREQNPQAYAQNQQTQSLQQQVQQLQSQLQQVTQLTQQQQEQAKLELVTNNIIAPFAEEHPRYHELEEDIAFFLNSGKIPSNLSERQRLEAAYDMAERINPVGYGSAEQVSPAQHAQRPINPAGSKSVRGAPSSGATAPTKNAKLSLDESIRRAVASIR